MLRAVHFPCFALPSFHCPRLDLAIRYAKLGPGKTSQTGVIDVMAEWMFLTNHAHVLLCIAEDPNSRLRDLASRVQISERAVKRIVADLERTGYISRHRFGRRNRYELHPDIPIHSPMTKTLEVGALLALLVPMIATRMA